MHGYSIARTAAAAMVAAGAHVGTAGAAEECVRVVMAEWNAETLSADPIHLISLTDDYHARMIFDPFVDLDDGLQPVSVLAESWTSNAEGTEWTFNVRPGVTFHDGTPLTAEDVVYSFQRHLDPANGSPALAEMAGIEADGLSVVDALTVKVTVKQPIAELPLLLATHHGFVVKNGATKEDLRFRPIGTGPFTMEELQPGQQKTVFTRNPNYWRDGLPKAECIELSAASEPVARAAAVLSGTADLVIVIDPSTVWTLLDNPDITLPQAQGGTALSMDMWVDTPPFDDNRVRQAMKLVVDRQAIIDTALLGFGMPGNDNPIPPGSPDAYRDDIIQQDIAKAKQLLVEAGHPDGISVDLYAAEIYPGQMPMVYAYQQMAAEAGISVNVIVGPSSEYWDNVWLKHPFAISNWAMRPTSAALAVGYRKNAAWNDSHFYRDDFDALLDQAAQTIDDDGRRELYKQAQRMIAEEGGVIIPAFSAAIAALGKGCSGYTPPADLNRVDFKNISCER